jgi:uncharacterized membrane protein
MVNHQAYNLGFSKKSFYLLIVSLLLLSIFLRFYNIDWKVYWDDEVYTSLRIAGHTESDLIQDFTNNHRILNVEDIQKYLHPSYERSLVDTIASLAEEDPQHPPLYFVIGYYWVKFFDSSVAGIRSLSAFIGLLVLPSIYWLCIELFNSSLVGLVAAALVAVSPFHVLYSQEAREYSLWTVMILLTSASLLRAVRLKNFLNWGVYTINLTLALYTFPLSGVVAIGYGFYLFTLESFRLSKLVLSFLLASLMSFLLFSPWLLIILGKVKQINKGMNSILSDSLHSQDVIKLFLANLKVVFIDVPSPILFLGILILIGYSVYYLCRRTSMSVWLFIVTMVIVSAMPVVLPDLLFGGGRTGHSRYMIPVYLGVELSIAYFLASQIFNLKIHIRLRRLWQLILVILLAVGIFSCIVGSQAETSWTKYGVSSTFPSLARIINQRSHPLIISDNYIVYPAALSYRLNSKASLNLRPHCYLCSLSPSSIDSKLLEIPNDFSSVFLLLPSQELKHEFEGMFKLTKADKDGFLWQVRPVT